MRTVKIEELTIEKFLPFGTYANFLNPQSEKIGAAPIEFFRDMVQQNLGTHTIASFSTCRVEKRAMIIDVTEYHSTTGEVMMPLDGDILIHVGPATPPGAEVPLDKIRVFHIPQGTLVSMRPGVWHHGPFTLNDNPVNVLIVLPERVYANDCVVAPLEADRQLKIEAV